MQLSHCTALHFNKAEVAHPSFTTSSFTAPRLFSSFTLSLQRSAARTATRNQHQSLLSCTVLLTSTSTPTTTTQKRSFAAKKKMPPKKAVKEEKLLLGRPGNNLKSGIVCSSHLLLLLQQPLKPLNATDNICRSVLQMWANRLSFKLSPNATLVTPP